MNQNILHLSQNAKMQTLTGYIHTKQKNFTRHAKSENPVTEKMIIITYVEVKHFRQTSPDMNGAVGRS